MEEINDSKTEPVSQTPAPVSEMPKKPKKNNLILVFIFVVMVLALSIGGYWYISNSRLRQDFGGQAPNRSGTGQAKLTPAPTSNTATSPVSSGNWDTSNWKTYTDDNFHISIKYPATYQVTPSKISGNYVNAATLNGDLNIAISQSTNPQNLPVKSWLSGKLAEQKKAIDDCTQDPNSVYCEGGLPTVFTEKEITIDDVSSLYQETSGTPVGRSTQVYIPHDKIIIVISMFVAGKNDPSKPTDNYSTEKFDQILSTFKFTYQTSLAPTGSVDTSNLKTYIKYGYSFQYPNNINLTELEDSSAHLGLWGPSQKTGTEFYDGINVTFKKGALEPETLTQLVDDQIKQLKAKYAVITTQPTKIKISSYDGYKFRASMDIEGEFIFLSDSDSYIEIQNFTRDPSNQGYNKIVDQILSTFKFLPTN